MTEDFLESEEATATLLNISERTIGQNVKSMSPGQLADAGAEPAKRQNESAKIQNHKENTNNSNTPRANMFFE